MLQSKDTHIYLGHISDSLPGQFVAGDGLLVGHFVESVPNGQIVRISLHVRLSYEWLTDLRRLTPGHESSRR